MAVEATAEGVALAAEALTAVALAVVAVPLPVVSAEGVAPVALDSRAVADLVALAEAHRRECVVDPRQACAADLRQPQAHPTPGSRIVIAARGIRPPAFIPSAAVQVQV